MLEQDQDIHGPQPRLDSTLDTFAYNLFLSRLKALLVASLWTGVESGYLK